MHKISKTIDAQIKYLLKQDAFLEPYQDVIRRRLVKLWETKTRLTTPQTKLSDFASGHTYYGMHMHHGEWVFREWAPNATSIFLVGDMTEWEERPSYALKRINQNGDWEIRLPLKNLNHGDHYRLRVHWPGEAGDRIPAYARRVVQDEQTQIFNAQMWHPEKKFEWRHPVPEDLLEPPLVYEAHIGMAQTEAKIGTYREFAEQVIPRVVKAGYNTLQLMGLQEHPYYGSFGYQVSSFFAASSRFGTPEDLKMLIDTAHGAGLRVIMDLIHSHSVSNEVEGLSRFDGSVHQYFHSGPRGYHPAWDSRCFDYGKHQVLHFLLSNCRFWFDEYHLDGFRFDGITSMLYRHHGLGHAFTSYDDYFNDALDDEALVYLALANELIHELNPASMTIAEDVSGLPGLAVPVEKGGVGFNFRFAMGVPDYWIRLTKDTRDEDWSMTHLWYELTNRRSDEKTISYAESHDQALVGDQTLIFRLMGDVMYHHMSVSDNHYIIDRGMALHKMIRLLTLATAGHGYLNFMGNEFGHPEWVDFPRRENDWSYSYARRQWNLMDDPGLKYSQLARYDRDMIQLAKTHDLFHGSLCLVHTHNDDKIIAFERNRLFFVFNFNPEVSFTDYFFYLPLGRYEWVFDSDSRNYGGYGRLDDARKGVYESRPGKGRPESGLDLHLPCRTVLVLSRLEK
ncbi:MAG: alpha amylase C-terminal domain-containing protein [Deltaproteobacteria bacterium]|jgi:1,4-alpha-glucan branching enzyme|nr:alpha amylase C-terminal domain-containing protein [Deltaproteobacteria bacterium]